MSLETSGRSGNTSPLDLAEALAVPEVGKRQYSPLANGITPDQLAEALRLQLGVQAEVGADRETVTYSFDRDAQSPDVHIAADSPMPQQRIRTSASIGERGIQEITMQAVGTSAQAGASFPASALRIIAHQDAAGNTTLSDHTGAVYSLTQSILHEAALSSQNPGLELLSTLTPDTESAAGKSQFEAIVSEIADLSTITSPSSAASQGQVRQTIGYIREQQAAGRTNMRVSEPDTDGNVTIEFYQMALGIVVAYTRVIDAQYRVIDASLRELHMAMTPAAFDSQNAGGVTRTHVEHEGNTRRVSTMYVVKDEAMAGTSDITHIEERSSYTHASFLTDANQEFPIVSHVSTEVKAAGTTLAIDFDFGQHVLEALNLDVGIVNGLSTIQVFDRRQPQYLDAPTKLPGETYERIYRPRHNPAQQLVLRFKVEEVGGVLRNVLQGSTIEPVSES